MVISWGGNFVIVLSIGVNVDIQKCFRGVDDSVPFLVESYTMVLRTEECYYEFVGTREFLCWYIEHTHRASLSHVHDDSHARVVKTRGNAIIDSDSGIFTQ